MSKQKKYNVQLFGVDCPEISQSYGMKAKRFTSKMVYGKKVIVDIKNKDKHGKYFGNVKVNEKSLNSELVKLGYAWCSEGHSQNKKLVILEKQARKKRIGLWHDKNPIAPWNYKKKKKKNR